MLLRFRKSIRILPGLRLNLGGKSTSVTLGRGRAHYTVNTPGQHTESIRIGDGLSWRKTSGARRKRG
jgi:Protein of unknown function (DUF4236)